MFVSEVGAQGWARPCCGCSQSVAGGAGEPHCSIQALGPLSCWGGQQDKGSKIVVCKSN